MAFDECYKTVMNTRNNMVCFNSTPSWCFSNTNHNLSWNITEWNCINDTLLDALISSHYPQRALTYNYIRKTYTKWVKRGYYSYLESNLNLRCVSLWWLTGNHYANRTYLYNLGRYQRITLRKHAYSNILKILPPKNENFQMKNSDIFSYFCSKHRLWVPFRTASTRRF